MFEEGAEGGGSVGLMSLSPPLGFLFPAPRELLPTFPSLFSPHFPQSVLVPTFPSLFSLHLPQPVQPELLPKVFLVSVLSVASPQAAVAVGKHHTPPAELLSRALDEVDKVVDKISC